MKYENISLCQNMSKERNHKIGVYYHRMNKTWSFVWEEQIM